MVWFRPDIILYTDRYLWTEPTRSLGVLKSLNNSLPHGNSKISFQKARHFYSNKKDIHARNYVFYSLKWCFLSLWHLKLCSCLAAKQIKPISHPNPLLLKHYYISVYQMNDFDKNIFLLDCFKKVLSIKDCNYSLTVSHFQFKPWSKTWFKSLESYSSVPSLNLCFFPNFFIASKISRVSNWKYRGKLRTWWSYLATCRAQCDSISIRRGLGLIDGKSFSCRWGIEEETREHGKRWNMKRTDTEREISTKASLNISMCFADA